VGLASAACNHKWKWQYARRPCSSGVNEGADAGAWKGDHAWNGARRSDPEALSRRPQKNGYPEPGRTITPSQNVQLSPGAARRMPFLELKPEIFVTSSSNSSLSRSRKSLTIIQTLVIVGTAGLIGSLLVKLLV